jgi:hypothetical protein
MSFFVKCPKQSPVQGRFKKVQMYGAIEDKGKLLCCSVAILIRLRRINTQHFMNLFPKVAKIAHKRLFTS